MKKFIQKNLPFLSILIIAALFLVPAILATDGWTGFGAVDGWTGFGAVDDWTGFGAVDGWTGFGAADGWTGLADTAGSLDSAVDEEEEEDEGYGPFDPVFDQDPIPPTGGGDVPPLDDLFEATIDLSLSDSPDPVQPGDELVYTITYYNRGNGDARDITITMDADALAPIQSSEPSATTRNNEWRIEEVKAHTGGEIKVTTKVKNKAEDGQTLFNTVTIDYYDPVYGEKKLDLTEETKVKKISDDTGDDTGDDTEDEDDEEIGIKILSTRFPAQSTSGEPVFMSLHIENDGTEDLEDVKISVVSQDLGIRTSAGPFDLDSKDEVTKTLLLDIPAEAPEGNYYLRFTITSNGQTRRTVYREIDLVSTLE